MVRHLLALGPFLFALTVSAPGCGKKEVALSDLQTLAAADPRVGQSIPNIASKDLEGRPLNLGDYRGKVVVLEFWADF